MSLTSLRDLRRARMKPGIVLVVVGKVPDVEDVPYLVPVVPGDRPALMDWRSLVGLPVALFTVDGHEQLGMQTLDALQASGARLIGSAWKSEALALEDVAKPLLRRTWDLLCQ